MDGETSVVPRARSRAGFSLAHGITSSEPEQWMNTMFSGSMLCAFFEKRMRGGANSGNLLVALFEPFWTSVGTLGNATIGWRRTSGTHWHVRDEWRRNAVGDGTLDALVLLEFRINRLCKLLTVCDCWPSNVGRHLAHWIDSHVHLAIQVEARGSGPSNDGLSNDDSSTSARCLSLTDWRHVDPTDVVGMREALVFSTRATPKRASPRATFYRKIIENVTACKAMGTVLRDFATDESRRKTTCAALVRCILGYDAHRADFALRMATHRALAEGPSSACERVIQAVERGGSTTVFVAFREFVVRNVLTDVDVYAHLSKTPRWNAYAANVVHAAETVRVRIRDKRPTTRVDDRRLELEDVIATSDEEATVLIRNCKKVPGPFVRTSNRAIDVFEAYKLVRRTRNRATKIHTFGGTDTFDDSGGTIVASLSRTRDRDIGAQFDARDVAEVLRTDDSRRLFVEVSRAMCQNANALRTIVEREVVVGGGAGGPFTRDFGLVSDALELVKHFSGARAHALPESIAEKQRDAVRRNFADKTCDESEMFRRRGEIVWCAGCGKVKNFVISSDKKNDNNHLATGYTRVCHVGDEIVCDEKKTFPCCRALPLRRATVLDASRSRCVQLFGTAYVVTTCCGKLARLEHVTCTRDDVFACEECATKRIMISSKKSARGGRTPVYAKTCRFCSEIVERPKGSFTGAFVEEDGTVAPHTFCKRHVRSFMRREFEPMDLAEVLREIPKTLKAA